MAVDSDYQENNQKNKQQLIESDTDNNLQPLEEQEYKEYGYRWVIVTIYVLANLAVSAMWITVSPIATQIESVYPSVNGLIVNLVTLMMPILYSIVNFPSIYILDGYGLQLGMIIAVALVIVGVWVRVFINTSFVFVMIGQILGGIGQPLILNSPAKVATFWFNSKNRPVVTGILSLINPLGVGLGFAIPSIFVTDNSNEKQMYNVMFWEAVMFTIMSLPCLFLFKAKPPTPPSSGAGAEKLEFKKSLKQLKKNKNYIFILIGFSFVTSNFSTLAALINEFTVAFGFNNDQASAFGAATVIFGLAGGIVGSVILMKTQKYKQTTIYYNIIALITFLLLSGLMFTESFILTLCGTFLFGFFNVGMIPLYMDFACEVTFPMGEAMSAGCMLTVLVVSLMFPTSDKKPMTKMEVLWSNLFGALFIVVPLILNFYIKEDLRRLKHEKNQSLLKKQQSNDYIDKENDPKDFLASNTSDINLMTTSDA